VALPAFFSASVSSFLHWEPASIVGSLSAALIKRFSGDHAKQLDSWTAQLGILRSSLQACAEEESVGRWAVLLEYPLLRLQRRLDVVLLCGSRVVVIEFKAEAPTYQPADGRQVEDYALDLRDFHEASHKLNIIPVLCATEAPTARFSLNAAPGVAPLCRCNKATLSDLLLQLASTSNGPQMEAECWNASPYRPVPSIIEAAELLYAGHQVAEIAHASSNPKNLTATTDRLIEIVAEAQREKRRIVVFVTGVPGSGKTLVGLNAIHDPRFRAEDRPAGAFLSGNTPLVTVLREALARDMTERSDKTLADARREVRTEIQGLMNYLEEYLVAHPQQAPTDHVIVFYEAQRAWDAEYGARKFNRQKSIATGGDATAWQSLFPGGTSPDWLARDERLHLSASVRSYRCLAVTQWVNALLEGRIVDANQIAVSTEDFPIYLSRSLESARRWLLENARGTRRCGLVTSSGARRLRADGLGVTLSANELSDVANWYLLPKGDIRSSYALEVAANEYTCQGLELDYVGVCWDGDLPWDNVAAAWKPRRLLGSQWQTVHNSDSRRWAINKYRVLLTRARLGSVIWVPEGNAEDPTRDLGERDGIAEVLSAAGALHLN
jgi:Schlafen group 3, DNA/RNA helicase domain